MKRVAILIAGALAAAAVASVVSTPGAPASAPLSAAASAPETDAPEMRASAPVPDPSKVADDRDDVGPCPPPYASIPVVRSGRDAQGRPTWWHEDGSCTMRVVQVAHQDGETYEIPAVVHLRPLPRR